MVARQGLDLNHPSFDGPEAPTTGFVAQVIVSVGRTDEYALPRFNDLSATEARAITLDGPADEGFQLGCFSATHGVHFRHLDQPLTAQML